MIVRFLWLFLAMPWVGLLCVIMGFPSHTQLNSFSVHLALKLMIGNRPKSCIFSSTRLRVGHYRPASKTPFKWRFACRPTVTSYCAQTGMLIIVLNFFGVWSHIVVLFDIVRSDVIVAMLSSVAILPSCSR